MPPALIAGLTLAVTAVSVVAQIKQGKKAAAADREARAISTAYQKNADRLARRQAAKSERIKRAQIQQASESAGVTGSSGVIGSQSALSANTGTAFGGQRGGAKAAAGISAANQAAATARHKASNAAAFGELINTGLSTVKKFKEVTKPL